MHSFLTAVAGTLLNLLLNALMIPYLGALGAAVATLLGYSLVYLIRIWDAPRLIPFRLQLPRQAVSIALLLGLAAVMTFVGKGRLLWALAAMLLVFALNLPTLIRAVLDLLRKRRHG